jgi:hypothetical protein
MAAKKTLKEFIRESYPSVDWDVFDQALAAGESLEDAAEMAMAVMPLAVFFTPDDFLMAQWFKLHKEESP